MQLLVCRTALLAVALLLASRASAQTTASLAKTCALRLQLHYALPRRAPRARDRSSECLAFTPRAARCSNANGNQALP